MRTFFYSGNSPVENGVSKQSHGTVTAEDDKTINEIIDFIIADQVEKLRCTNYVLTAFNEISVIV